MIYMTEMEFETTMPGALLISGLVLVIFTWMFVSVGQTQQKRIVIEPDKNLDKDLTKVLSDVNHCYGMGMAVSNIFMKSVKGKSTGLNCSLFCSKKNVPNFKERVTVKVVRYNEYKRENIPLKLKNLPEELEANKVYQVYLEDTGALGSIGRIFTGSGKIKIRGLKGRDCSNWEEVKD